MEKFLQQDQKTSIILMACMVMAAYNLFVNVVSTETDENRQYPLQYSNHVPLWGKNTIHLNAEVLCEGQINEKAEKQSCCSVVYCSLGGHAGTNSAVRYSSFDPELI